MSKVLDAYVKTFGPYRQTELTALAVEACASPAAYQPLLDYLQDHDRQAAGEKIQEAFSALTLRLCSTSADVYIGWRINPWEDVAEVIVKTLLADFYDIGYLAGKLPEVIARTPRLADPTPYYPTGMGVPYDPLDPTPLTVDPWAIVEYPSPGAEPGTGMWVEQPGSTLTINSGVELVSDISTGSYDVAIDEEWIKRLVDRQIDARKDK